MKFAHILFPVDFSQRASDAAPYVEALATRFDAKVTLIHAPELLLRLTPFSDIPNHCRDTKLALILHGAETDFNGERASILAPRFEIQSAPHAQCQCPYVSQYLLFPADAGISARLAQFHQFRARWNELQIRPGTAGLRRVAETDSVRALQHRQHAIR